MAKGLAFTDIAADAETRFREPLPRRILTGVADDLDVVADFRDRA